MSRSTLEALTILGGAAVLVETAAVWLQAAADRRRAAEEAAERAWAIRRRSGRA